MWIGGQNVKQDFSTKTLVLFSDFAAEPAQCLHENNFPSCTYTFDL